MKDTNIILCNDALLFRTQHLGDEFGFEQHLDVHMKTCDKCRHETFVDKSKDNLNLGTPHLKTITVNGEDVQVNFVTVDNKKTPY